MSPIAIPSSVTAALPALNVHPHGHGHKKGAELDLSNSSTDSTSSTAAQVPVASAQNLFGKAFTALEQLIGLTPPAASTPAAATNTNSAAASATVNPKINLMA
ncbi:MAG TPA: hypothetical protein VE058_06805 [Steroidobacteraceae bacterium]|nr:hypothetical protein [Steroidobacteraceae bacterium]